MGETACGIRPSVYCQNPGFMIKSIWDKIKICAAAGSAEWRRRMKAFDCVNKQEVEVTKEGLIDFMKKDRQIDMKFAEKRTDDMGYLTWDAENWTCVDGQNKFMRCYSLEGRVLRDSTSHNIYDMENDFFPEQAMEIQIN